MPAGRPRIYADAADKQRAYRERNDPSRLLSHLRSAICEAKEYGLLIRLDPIVLLDGGQGQSQVLNRLLSEVRRQVRDAKRREETLREQYSGIQHVFGNL